MILGPGCPALAAVLALAGCAAEPGDVFVRDRLVVDVRPPRIEGELPGDLHLALVWTDRAAERQRDRAFRR